MRRVVIAFRAALPRCWRLLWRHGLAFKIAAAVGVLVIWETAEQADLTGYWVREPGGTVLCLHHVGQRLVIRFDD